MNSLPNLNDDAISLRLQQSRQLEDAPEHVIQRALELWQMPRRAASGAKAEAGTNMMRRIVAVLSFDSGAASPAAFGMRSAGGTMRQMLFSADAHDIDLRISSVSPAAGDSGNPGLARWQFSGQVLGPDCSGSVALTPSKGGAAQESLLNELGEFHLPAIPSGSYALSLRLGGVEVALSTIDVPQVP